MKRLEKVFKVLADKNRIRIIKLLEKKKMCVCELAHVLGITQPSVSRHLKKLKSAGFIGDEQDGFWTNYFLAQSTDLFVTMLMAHLHNWLNDDPLVKGDIEKAHKAERSKLCCK